MDLAGRLREHGLRVTSQRLATYEALRSLGRHATAEELLRAVTPRLPAMSLPTIYAGLELLVELGLVRKIASAGGTAFYDPILTPHHHLICADCGAIEDLPVVIDAGAVRAAAAEQGFEARSVEVTVRGRCRRCRNLA